MIYIHNWWLWCAKWIIPIWSVMYLNCIQLSCYCVLSLDFASRFGFTFIQNAQTWRFWRGYEFDIDCPQYSIWIIMGFPFKRMRRTHSHAHTHSLTPVYLPTPRSNAYTHTHTRRIDTKKTSVSALLISHVQTQGYPKDHRHRNLLCEIKLRKTHMIWGVYWL